MKKKYLLTSLFIFSLIPIVFISVYSFPNADDFGFGNLTHKAYLSGGILSMFKMAIYNVIDFYYNWQGTYSAIFLFSLQPGIFNEQYYFLSHLILISSFILANIYFLNVVLTKISTKFKYIIILIILWIQIQFVYDAVSSFYWYNGSIYYTFFYSLELILIGELFKNKPKFLMVMILSLIIAGGNFVTSLNLMLILGLFNLYHFYVKSKTRYYYLISLVLLSLGMLISIKAPGNSVRALYYQDVSLGALDAIYFSFIRAFEFSYRLFNFSNLFSMLVILILLKDTYHYFKFKYPLLVLVIFFGIYAAHFTAPLYAMGYANLWTRIINIIYFKSYYLLLLSLYYLVGYFKLYRFFNFKILKFSVLALIISLSIEFKNSLTYQSLISLINHSAYNYHLQWQDRLKLLKDDKIKKVEFEKIKARNHPVFFMDGNDDGDDWIQKQMADYYDKEIVIIK